MLNIKTISIQSNQFEKKNMFSWQVYIAINKKVMKLMPVRQMTYVQLY